VSIYYDYRDPDQNMAQMVAVGALPAPDDEGAHDIWDADELDADDGQDPNMGDMIAVGAIPAPDDIAQAQMALLQPPQVRRVGTPTPPASGRATPSTPPPQRPRSVTPPPSGRVTPSTPPPRRPRTPTPPPSGRITPATPPPRRPRTPTPPPSGRVTPTTPPPRILPARDASAGKFDLY
jgi:hypothetical protein